MFFEIIAVAVLVLCALIYFIVSRTHTMPPIALRGYKKREPKHSDLVAIDVLNDRNSMGAEKTAEKYKISTSMVNYLARRAKSILNITKKAKGRKYYFYSDALKKKALKDFDAGFSYPEIAERNNIPFGSVSWIIRSARAIKNQKS